MILDLNLCDIYEAKIYMISDSFLCSLAYKGNMSCCAIVFAIDMYFRWV